jgi:hypothetical protein
MKRNVIRLFTSMVAMLAMAAVCLAADFAGAWKGEAKGKKKSVDVVLNLKVDGNAWSGTMAQGRRGKSVDLQDVKVEGDQVTFSTVRKSKKGERTVRWTGTMKDGQLELSQGGGKKRGEAITLKRGA